MISCLRVFAVLIVAAFVVSCSPTKRVFPPSASIQQLSVLPDGHWQVDIRLQNFSEVSVHYSTLNAQLTIAGITAGELKSSPNMDIAGGYADVDQVNLVAAAAASQPLLAASASGTDIGVAYTIKGKIVVSDPKDATSIHEYPFEHSSRLTPIPGLTNVYR
jgi:hypothetical protein